LKDKIEELIHAGYLSQFVKRSNNHPVEARPKGQQESQHKNHDANKKGTNQKIKGNRATTSKYESDNLRKNKKMSPPNKSEV